MTAPLRRCSTCRAPMVPEAQVCGLCVWDALPEADDPTAPAPAGAGSVRRCWCGRTVSTLPDSNGIDCAEHDGPHTVIDRPDIPLTWGERDRFDDLTAQLVQPRTVRYYTPRARLRRLAARIAASPFAEDLRASVRAAFWPAVVCAGLFLGAYLMWATRGMYVTVDGWQPIPTGGTR
jgi:hypothetical protein